MYKVPFAVDIIVCDAQAFCHVWGTLFDVAESYFVNAHFHCLRL